MGCIQSRGALHSHTTENASGEFSGGDGGDTKKARKEHIKQRKGAEEPLNEGNQYKGGQ